MSSAIEEAAMQGLKLKFVDFPTGDVDFFKALLQREFWEIAFWKKVPDSRMYIETGERLKVRISSFGVLHKDNVIIAGINVVGDPPYGISRWDYNVVFNCDGWAEIPDLMHTLAKRPKDAV